MTLRKHILVILAYALFGLILMAPVLPSVDQAIPGGTVAAIDGWQHVWHVWWVHYALTQGMHPLFTPLLYYPEGVDLALHPLNLSNGLLVFPVTALAGPLAGFNVAVLLALTLAGLAAFWFARQLGAQPGVAFVAGLIFTWSPYHMTKVWDGQLELIAVQWLPLYALFLLRTVTRPGYRDPLLAALFLALIGYTSLYYLLFIAIYSLAFALLALVAPRSLLLDGTQLAAARAGLVPTMPVQHRQPFGRAVLTGRMALVGGLALALLFPLLWPVLAPMLDGPRESVGQIQRDAFLVSRSANLLDPFLPSNLHPIWGPTVQALGQRWHPDIAAWNVALGYTTLALASLGTFVAWRTAWRWFCLGLLGLLFAFGPVLTVGEFATGLPMPYLLLLNIPGLGIAQRPGHFVIITSLALIPLTAYGLTWLTTLLTVRHGPRAAYASLFLVTALVAVEYVTPPLPLQRSDVPPVYQDLATQPEALLVLPVRQDSFSLRAQLVHQRPILGGYLARNPPNRWAERRPAIRQLWQMEPEPDRLLAPGVQGPMILDVYGIRQVLVHWDQLPPQAHPTVAAALQQALPGLEPASITTTYSLYHIPVTQQQPFGYFAEGWYPEEQVGERSWRWMSEEGVLALVNPSSEPAMIQVQMQAESYQVARPVQLMLNAQALGTWQVPAQPAHAATTLRLVVPPGEHNLYLRAPADADPRYNGPLSIVLTRIEVVGLSP